jgi:hypothetical protein
MKLYRVHIDRVLYVLADDAFEAERLAIEARPNMDETEVDVEPATAKGVQMDGWMEFPPYGLPLGMERKAKDLVPERLL